MSRSAALRALWVAIGVQLAGRLLDLRWHLANDEFEGATQQLEAHWLLWLGVVGMVAVALAALRSPAGDAERGGWYALLASAAVYIGVAVWHFIEHANGADPELAHVLLAITAVLMILAAIYITFRAWRARAPAPA
jgi:apolipoprotein N-acyltransferase